MLDKSISVPWSIEIENPPSNTISPMWHTAVDVIGLRIPLPKLSGVPVTDYVFAEFITLGPSDISKSQKSKELT